MTLFDLSRLGGWADLDFFRNDLRAIERALRAETRPVFPPAQAVFHALERTQPEATRVVILGQDPYHTPGKADGLAFSIPVGFGGRLDSLGNIFKEIEADLGCPRSRTDLSDWADQGVLLLNTALTVPQGAPKAHAKLGWDRLVRDVLRRLSDRPRAYLLWGGPAQQAAHSVAAPRTSRSRPPIPRPCPRIAGFWARDPSAARMDGCRRRGSAP